jgi:hypothetical protein
MLWSIWLHQPAWHFHGMRAVDCFEEVAGSQLRVLEDREFCLTPLGIRLRAFGREYMSSTYTLRQEAGR